MSRTRSLLMAAAFAVTFAPPPPVGAKTIKELEDRVATLEAGLAQAQAAIAALQANGALALGPFVQVVDDPLAGLAGPHVVLEGVNLHVRSGSGATDDGG